MGCASPVVAQCPHHPGVVQGVQDTQSCPTLVHEEDEAVVYLGLSEPLDFSAGRCPQHNLPVGWGLDGIGHFFCWGVLILGTQDVGTENSRGTFPQLGDRERLSSPCHTPGTSPLFPSQLRPLCSARAHPSPTRAPCLHPG